MAGFTHSFRVPFSDSDAAGIVHFSRLLPHVESAEAAWLESLGLKQYEELPDGRRIGFPKISIRCDFRSPIRPAEQVCITLNPDRVGDSSFTYTFAAHVGARLAAEGSISLLFASIGPQGIEKQALPAALRDLLPSA